MLTKSKIIGSAVAVACVLAAAQSASPAHAAQPVSGARSSMGNDATPKARLVADTTWPWPVIGEVVTAYRNGDDPYAAGQHRGVDIAAPVGTPARAVVAGRVSFSGRLPDGGNVVTLRTSDGRYLVSYLHLAARTVRRGAAIGVGEALGETGTTGRRSIDAPHLHFSVRLAATRAYLDPMRLLGEPRLATPVANSPAPAVDAQPVPEHAAVPRVKVAPLEQPAELRATTPLEHSDTPKNSKPASNATDRAVARPNAAPSADASVKAPEPIELEADTSDAGRGDSGASIDASHSIGGPSLTDQQTTQNRLPLRTILFALAALAFVGLAANRRPCWSPRTSQPPSPPSATEHENAEVVTLDTIRPTLADAARGRARDGRP